jgi:uncharacterized protein (DUF885 family)
MEPSKRFDKLEKEFFHEWVGRNPLLGTSLGLHDECDDKLPDGTFDKLQEDVRFLKRYETEFSQIDGKRLSSTRSVDLDLALQTIRTWIFDREELRFWERSPEAPQVLGHSIFQLLSRNFAPLAQRLRSIMKRLEALPKYLEETHSQLRAPVKMFIENELETLTRLPGFLNVLKDVSRDNIPATQARQLHRLIETLQNALERYSDWLIVDILPECRDEFPIGEAKFRKCLEMRGIHESPSQLISYGEAEMGRLAEKLKEVAKQIRRKIPLEDVREMIKQLHPDNFDGALRFVRDQVHKTKQFVNRSKFADLPPGETLYVTETPSYLRHILPFGSYSPPARMETKRDGYYYVTPGDCDSDKLKEHNFAALTNMTIHEGYPGQHLFFAWTSVHPSLIRSFANDPMTKEGWAHYSEERMKEMGYDDTPPSRFMMLQGQYFRAVRVVMDVKISIGKMGNQEGVEYLIDMMGMDRVAAEAEMRRYVVTPGYSLSYLLGKEKIKELKKWTREKMKVRFQENFFHNAVLQSSPLPIPLLKRDLEWRIEEELAKPAPKELTPAEKKVQAKKIKELGARSVTTAKTAGRK